MIATYNLSVLFVKLYYLYLSIVLKWRLHIHLSKYLQKKATFQWGYLLFHDSTCHVADAFIQSNLVMRVYIFMCVWSQESNPLTCWCKCHALPTELKRTFWLVITYADSALSVFHSVKSKSMYPEEHSDWVAFLCLVEKHKCKKWWVRE